MSNILELMVCILMSLNINSVNSITVDRVEDGITTLEVVTDNNIYMYNKPSEWHDFDGMVYYKANVPMQMQNEELYVIVDNEKYVLEDLI